MDFLALIFYVVVEPTHLKETLYSQIGLLWNPKGPGWK